MRPAGSHLTPQEVDLLLFGPADPRDSDTDDASAREAQQHFSECAVCQSVAEKYRKADEMLRALEWKNKGSRSQSGSREQRSPDCPADDDVWLSWTAGLLTDEEAAGYVAHAAACNRCAPLLREAMEDMAQDATAEEREALAKLPSASPGWQRAMAQKMAASGSAGVPLVEVATPARNKDPKSKERAGFAWWPRLVWAGAGLAVVVVAVLVGIRLTREPDVNALLAQAYTEQRTLDMRIPGAAHSKRAVTRGGPDSSINRPLVLLDAENVIAHHLQREPDNAHWLQLRARTEILEGHSDTALEMLRSLPTEEPARTSVQLDLAIAYVERGNAMNHPSDYSEAIELLEKVLHSDPRNPIALFNEALVLEKLSLFNQAINKWNRYLEVDSSSSWAGEARENLARVNRKLEEKQKTSQSLLRSPAEFSSEEEGESGGRISDERVEQYLELAMRSWLARAYAQPAADVAQQMVFRRALRALSAPLKNDHDDPWLADVQKILEQGGQQQAVKDAAASDEALNTGRYQASIQYARNASAAFQHSGNSAGELWVGFAMVYAQTFALKFSECSARAAALLPEIKARRYHWLHIQVLLQEGQCQEGSGHIEEAMRHTSTAERLAEQFHYPSLALRSRTLSAMYSVYTGDFDAALGRLVQGLDSFWHLAVNHHRGENLYSSLSVLADARGWNHVNAFATAELLADFTERDPVDHAIQLQFLALAEEQAGDYDDATRTLDQVSQMLMSLPEDRAVHLRRAEIALQNVRMHLTSQNSTEALSSLENLKPAFERAEAGQFQASYFQLYAEVLMSQGRQAEAATMLERALSICEKYLNGLHSEAERLFWSRFEVKLYRDLLTIKLQWASPEEALSWWEWYKGASVRTGVNHGQQSPLTQAGTLSNSWYWFPSKTVLISYIVEPGSLRAFVFHNGVVTIHLLKAAAELEPLVLGFARHCSAPVSFRSSLDNEATRLYGILLAPLEPELSGATTLLIESEGFLDRVPFDLLRDKKGSYLGDILNIAYSPGLGYLRSTASQTIGPDSKAVVFASVQSPSSGFPSLAETEEEAEEVSALFHHAKFLSGGKDPRELLIRTLPEAKLFHFAGHAIANVRTAGLLLGGNFRLEASDLERIDIHRMQLAVLSGCDTASGSSGGYSAVNSLTRTLMAGGARQVVASRWQVDSLATRALMREFYANLLSGKTPGESLRSAKGVIRQTPGYDHPYYWGSFAVFGR
jgi:CHAT domain-containing protein/tetratricopeptide (TPR) repeat protein